MPTEVADLNLDLDFSPLSAVDMSALTPSPPPEATPATDEAGPTITVNTKTAPPFPPPKTDKPRPHVCTTCQRSFARLEHLKRHERSHTKEKPFECSQCTRCFARRDLLLRHQQKLHQSTTPAARPRNRRESTTGVAPSRVRKSGMAIGAGASGMPGSRLAASNGSAMGSESGPSMRPRANTISHVDASGMHMMASDLSLLRGIPPGMHSRHPSLAGFPASVMDPFGDQSQSYLGMSSALGHRGIDIAHGLPKLDTQAISSPDFSGLHSATSTSVGPLFSPDFTFEGSTFCSSNGNTVNPNALHYTDSPQSFALDPASAFSHGMGGFHSLSSARDSFDWLTGFENQLSFGSAIDENAVDESSPSAMSTTSQSGISDIMLDGSTNVQHASSSGPPASSSAGSIPTSLSMWGQNDPMASHHMATSFSLDLGSTSFSDLLTGFPMSPHASNSALNPSHGIPASSAMATDPYLSTPPPSLTSLSPSMLTTLNPANLTLGFDGGAAPETPTSLNGSHNGSHTGSHTGSHDGKDGVSEHCSAPVSTITDSTRNAIVSALSSAALQSSPFSMRKCSFNGSGPSSAYPSNMESPVPSTCDLQRYVGSYFRHFQPQFPFLHVATVSFEIPSEPGTQSAASSSANGRISSGNRGINGAVGSSGCLILSMAAIGALYESDHEQSKALFTMAKRMIQIYLDERRRAHVRKAPFRRSPGIDASGHQTPTTDHSADTPLWLVQAMLLNVVYGHNGIDKRAGEIASTHCAALVSLAQGAELLRQRRTEPDLDDDLTMSMDGHADAGGYWANDVGSSATAKAAKEQEAWLKWKDMEERKRTLYAIFTLSSLLVSAYNHPPALTNSEILLDLPCDEEFFAAPTCAAFMAMGGVAAANHNRMTFHEALGNLLRASERRMKRMNGDSTAGSRLDELQPSTFGCFILINALHNYIWETRQRHHNRVWTTEETDKMHRHIEPALQAWQHAWERNPHHSALRVSVTGLTALSASSMPLLELAYVRLFVNLSRSKEKFWQRNWDGLVEELSRGGEIAPHIEASPASNADSAMTDPSTDVSGNTSSVLLDSPVTQLSSPDFGSTSFQGPQGQQQQQQQQQQSTRDTTRRERHLRRAAFYAANSLCSTGNLGLVLTELTGHDLPLQTALCAFDCAQVLAEWVATLQDRVGRYLGIFGHDDVDLSQVPAIMLLEEEDVKLLKKIQDILSSLETRMNTGLTSTGSGPGSMLGFSGQPVTHMHTADQIGLAAKLLSVTAYTLGKLAAWPVTHLMAECLENHAGHMRSRAEKSVTACH